MLKSSFIFGSFDSSESSGKYYKIEPINFPTPEKDVINYEVPGRSGDLLVDFGSYKNVELSFAVAIESKDEGDTFLTLYDALRTAIMVQSGYQRLEDSLYPNEYRMARAVSVEVGKNDTKNGTAIITLDAKPQRYLTSGETDALVIDSPTSTQLTATDAWMADLNDDSRNALGFLGVIQDYEVAVFDLSGYVGGTNVLKLIYPTTYNVRMRVNNIIRTDLVPWVRDSVSPLTTPSSGYPGANATKMSDDYTITISLSNFNPWYAIPMPIQGYVIDPNNDIIAALLPEHGTAHYPSEAVGGTPLIKLDVTGAIDVAPAVNIADRIIINLNTPASIDGVTITEICLDLDTYNAYFTENGATYNLNPYVSISGNMNYNGDIDVAIDNRIDALHYIPRWWKL